MANKEIQNPNRKLQLRLTLLPSRDQLIISHMNSRYESRGPKTGPRKKQPALARSWHGDLVPAEVGEGGKGPSVSWTILENSIQGQHYRWPEISFPFQKSPPFGKKTWCFSCHNSWGVGLCPRGGNGDAGNLAKSVTIHFILWPNLLPNIRFVSSFPLDLSCTSEMDAGELPGCSVPGKGRSCPRGSWKSPLFHQTCRSGR